MNRVVLLSLTLAVASTLTCSASLVLLSTTGQPQAGDIFMPGPSVVWAFDFQTGADPTTLNEFTLKVSNADSIAHTLFASIYSDLTSAPGSLIDSFDTPITMAPLASTADRNAADPGINLMPNTKYWLVFGMGEAAVLSNPVRFRTLMPPGGGVDPGGVYLDVPGTTTAVSTNGGLNWSSSGFPLPYFQLAGAPEPSRAGFMLISLILAASRRRRSRESGSNS